MKKYIHIAIVAALLVGSLASNASFAQVGYGTQVSVPGLPGNYTIIPGGEIDARDEIVQLNNLTLQNTPTGGSPSMLYASYTPGMYCSKFYSTNSYGSPITCPTIGPNVLYQIQVDAQTALLLRNRQRASLGDFAAGDHLNVFGFIDTNTNYVQALIVRDLDRPAQYQQQYVQLNSVQALSSPSASYPPATFEVLFGSVPCWLYTGANGVRAGSFCPYYVSSQAGMPSDLALTKHQIRISSQTIVMDQFRREIPLSAIQPGDQLNIYGRYSSQDGSMDALIVRDLSKGGSSYNTASIRVTVVDTSIQCFRAPCGLLPGVQVSISGVNTSLYSVSQTDGNGEVYFSNLPNGTYTVRTLDVNRPASQTVNAQGGESKITLYVNRGYANGVQITGISPQVVAPGGTVTLTGNGFTSQGNVVYLAREDGSYQTTVGTFSSNGNTLTFQIPQYWSASYCVSSPSCGILPNGNYKITVQNQNGTSQAILLSVSSGSSNSYTTVLYPNGGEQLTRNSQYEIRWSAPYANTGNSFDIFVVQRGLSGDVGTSVQYTLARNVYLGYGITNGSYQWNVGVNQEGMQMPNAANYYVRICNAGTSVCDESNAPFSIFSNIGQGVQLYGIQPGQGAPGTTVSLSGNGFTVSGNTIVFDGQYQVPANLVNATTLSFQMPDYVGMYCAPNMYCTQIAYQLPAGIHGIAVENANGRSNSLQFNLYR